MAICFVLPIAIACADTPKSALEANVNAGITNVLLAQGSAGSAVPKRIPEVANLLSKTIDGIDDGQIDDKLGGWITTSFVSLVRNRASVFLATDPSSDPLLQQLVAQAKLRFQGMTNAKGLQLLALRDSLLAGDVPYWPAVYLHITNRLRGTAEFQMDVGQDAVEGYNESFFSKVVGGINQEDRPKFQGEPVDLRSNRILSTVLTTALIYEVLLEVQVERGADVEFSFGNIFTPMYDDGDPYGARNQPSFSQVTNDFDQYYDQCVTTSGAVTKVDLSLFTELANKASWLRFKKRPNFDASPDLLSEAAELKFTNEAFVWDNVMGTSAPPTSN